MRYAQDQSLAVLLSALCRSRVTDLVTFFIISAFLLAFVSVGGALILLPPEGFCGRGPPLPGGRGASLGGILAVFDDDASYGGIDEYRRCRCGASRQVQIRGKCGMSAVTGPPTHPLDVCLLFIKIPNR